MSTAVEAIRKHLEDKGVYTKEYIDRVEAYMLKHPDLAEEFAYSLPKNTFPDHYIVVKDMTARYLGSTTMLSKSAIYVVLSRLAEDEGEVSTIINEELEYFQKNRKSRK